MELLLVVSVFHTLEILNVYWPILILLMQLLMMHLVLNACLDSHLPDICHLNVVLRVKCGMVLLLLAYQMSSLQTACKWVFWLQSTMHFVLSAVKDIIWITVSVQFKERLFRKMKMKNFKIFLYRIVYNWKTEPIQKLQYALCATQHILLLMEFAQKKWWLLLEGKNIMFQILSNTVNFSILLLLLVILAFMVLKNMTEIFVVWVTKKLLITNVKMLLIKLY